MNGLGIRAVGCGRQLFAVILTLLASNSIARAASSVTLEWDPSPDTSVVGYILYSGAIGGHAINATEVENQTTATVTDLFGGTTNFFFVVAVNAQNVPSAPSDRLVIELPGIYLPPTISGIPDQVVDANTASELIPFTIDDAQFPAGRLALRATSSNWDLVPEAKIIFGGSGSNRSVIVVPTFGRFGSAMITVTVDDGIATASTSFILTVARLSPVYLPFEAESADVVSPMAVSADPSASGGQFAATAGGWQGSVTFTVDMPLFSSGITWCRVLGPPPPNGSFAVSADGGGADIFDVAPGNTTNEWQWSVVKGRGGPSFGLPADGDPINPRVFPFSAGRHRLTFQAREPNTGIDQILITNDPDYIPTGTFSTILLTVPPDQTINELTTLIVTNTATASDPSTTPLTFLLDSHALGRATIDPVSGVLTWTPTEAQGPSTNVITVRVADNSSPPRSATRSFRVIVNEVNEPPVLTVPGDMAIDEVTTLAVQITATDPDIPTNKLAFSLVSAPAGMVLNSETGALLWTPTESQGGSTYLITVRVTDNGSPPLSDTRSFAVVVNKVNSAPVLTVQPNKVIHGLATLVVTNFATDSDLPPNKLTFSLQSAPDGMSLDPSSGVLTWTPTEAQRPSTNLITVVVTDDGTPPLSDTNSFTVAVNEVNSAPLLAPVADRIIPELTTLVVTNRASDADVPVETLTFSLVSAPEGMSLDSNTGVLTWTPTEAQGPSTNTIRVRASDDGSPSLSATNSFTIVVTEVNSPPEAGPVADQTINELSTLVVTIPATDADIPTNTLTFSLASAPTGMRVDSKTGVLTWTPSEAQGPSTNVILVRVADNGTPPLRDFVRFTVVVKEVNSRPLLATIADQVAFAGFELSVTNSATDPDIPTNILTFSLDPGAPAGAIINPTSGVFTWTPTTSQAPSTNLVIVRVTDNGVPSLSDTKPFKIVVAPPPTAIESILVSGDTVAITWNAVPGKTYRVQFKSDLGEATWRNVAGDVTASGSTAMKIDFTKSSARRYYRVMVLP